MPRSTPFRFIRVSDAIPLLLAALVAVVSSASATPVFSRQDESAAAMTDGQTQVIAQGVAAAPTGEAVWRTVRTRAMPVDQSTFEPRSLGFVLATTGSLLLTDANSGEQVRLGAGEAAFVPAGVIQRRASLIEQPVTYLAIELVARDAPSPAADATVLQPGQPFSPPAGLRDLDLLSGLLLGDEIALVPDTGAKNVILITDGAANVGRAGGEPVVLLAGEAASFSGELQVAPAAGGGEPRVAFVVATIGPEVPPPPALAISTPSTQSTPSPLQTAATPSRNTGGPGSISLQVFSCPPGMEAATLAVAACAPAAAGFDIAIEGGVLTAPLTIGNASVDGDSYTWTGLQPGEYRVSPSALPSGATSYVLSARNAAGDPESGFTVSLDAENPALPLRIYLLFPG